MEIVHAVIDHEGGFAGCKLVALRRTNRPDSCSGNWLTFTVGPRERCTTPLLDIDPEMSFVPSSQPKTESFLTVQPCPGGTLPSQGLIFSIAVHKQEIQEGSFHSRMILSLCLLKLSVSVFGEGQVSTYEVGPIAV
jgi:hypothetical protein